MIKKALTSAVLTLVVLISLLALGSAPAGAAATAQAAPVVQLEGAPLALKNAGCASGHLCLLPCFLAESCNAWFDSPISTGCFQTNAGGLEHLTYSIKNNMAYQIWVYHSTNCTQAAGIAPVYAHTSGNMNNEWAGAGIKSFRRA
jgi:hypothetical protein